MPHLDARLSQEIKHATQHLGLWRGGPEVDYTHALERYAVNVTVVHIPRFGPTRAKRSSLTPNTPALLVQCASGDGEIGSFSGVSGYVGMVKPPPNYSSSDQMSARDFDPVHYTICAELAEECGLSLAVVKSLTLYLGKRFWEPTSLPGGRVHVVPVLAVYPGKTLPKITIDTVEVSSFVWIPLGQIPTMRGINAGYVKNTLPRILRAM